VAKVTIVFGVALALLGVVGYVMSGGVSLTALIPMIPGSLLVICGLLALNEKRLKMAMHTAVLVGLLACLGAVPGLLRLPQLLSGGEVARPAAVIAQSIMALLMAIYVGLCVKSFVDARRARKAAGV
jgi:hypothetical protein